MVGDLNCVPFRPRSFDYVCISDVLEHIPDDRRALYSVWEAVAAGGSLVIHVPSERQSPIRWIREALEQAEKEDHQEFPHVRDGYSPESLRKLAETLRPASNRVQPSFSPMASLITDIDWLLWRKGLKAPRTLTWLGVRATRPPLESEGADHSSGLVCVVGKAV